MSYLKHVIRPPSSLTGSSHALHHGQTHSTRCGGVHSDRPGHLKSRPTHSSSTRLASYIARLACRRCAIVQDRLRLNVLLRSPSTRRTFLLPSTLESPAHLYRGSFHWRVCVSAQARRQSTAVCGVRT